METVGLYLLKCSGVLFLFWATYHLFLKQETLFKENRWFLISGIVISFLFPLYKIKNIVVIDVVPTLDTYAATGASFLNAEGNDISFNEMVLLTYLVGALFFILRFFVRLYQIARLTKDSETWKENDLRHFRTNKRIAPFSFFKSLFYNPKQFQEEELRLILSHEKVHAKQWHSVDVILGELLKIVLWFNPLVWFYHKSIKQNLEFLADANAVSNCNRKSYQYLMVSQATGQQLKLTNSFYNSLIKKRIVMLNKEQSKKMNAFKSLFILPFLAIFLVSFNTENIYQFQKNGEEKVKANEKTVELTIDKNTTDEELLKIKKDLAEDEIDFSYTTVRNDDKEIIDISIQISGKNEKGETFSGNYASNSDGPIDPLVIFYDDEANVLSIGNSTKHHLKLSNKGDHTMVWNGLDEIGEHEDIVIIKEDGSKKVILNGKEIDQDSLQSKELNVFVVDGEHDGNAMVHISSKDGKVLEEKIMKIQKGKDHVHIDIDQDDDAYEKHIKVKRGKSKRDKNVFIVKDTDEESDVEVLNLNEGFFFVDTDGKDPLYIIDGKEATKKEVKKLSPKKIVTIDVSKGEAAIKKYGNKAKDGVVEIITKNKD